MKNVLLVAGLLCLLFSSKAQMPHLSFQINTDSLLGSDGFEQLDSSEYSVEKKGAD